jgi:hypothetical protein
MTQSVVISLYPAHTSSITSGIDRVREVRVGSPVGSPYNKQWPAREQYNTVDHLPSSQTSDAIRLSFRVPIDVSTGLTAYVCSLI